MRRRERNWGGDGVVPSEKITALTCAELSLSSPSTCPFSEDDAFILRRSHLEARAARRETRAASLRSACRRERSAPRRRASSREACPAEESERRRRAGGRSDGRILRVFSLDARRVRRRALAVRRRVVPARGAEPAGSRVRVAGRRRRVRRRRRRRLHRCVASIDRRRSTSASSRRSSLPSSRGTFCSLLGPRLFFVSRPLVARRSSRAPS